MCKGGNPNTLKMKIKQMCGMILRVWHSAGPSSAFEKWSGHDRSKTFTSAEGTSRGRAREGAFPLS